MRWVCWPGQRVWTWRHRGSSLLLLHHSQWIINCPFGSTASSVGPTASSGAILLAG